jgi:hypothetical protein
MMRAEYGDFFRWMMEMGSLRKAALKTFIFLAVIVNARGACACDIEQVVSDIQYKALNRAGELAKQQLGLLNRFRAIGDHAKDPHKALNKQLSQDDLADFARTKQRYQAIEVQQMLESNFSRDANVIREFFYVAQADYLGAPVPKEGDKNYLPYAFLAVMAAASESDEIKNDLVTEPVANGCNLESALHSVELESMQRLQKLPLAQASQEITAMRARNGGRKLHPENLNAADRTIFDKWQRSAYVPALREKQFITNLESLKLLARTSAMKFELGKKDAIDSGGDIDSVGTSISALKLDTRAKIGFNMLDKIADKYPSDWFKQHAAIKPAVDAIKKEDAARLRAK